MTARLQPPTSMVGALQVSNNSWSSSHNLLFHFGVDPQWNSAASISAPAKYTFCHFIFRIKNIKIHKMMNVITWTSELSTRS